MTNQTFVKDYKEWRELIVAAISKNIGAPFVSTGLTLNYEDGYTGDFGTDFQGRCYVTLNGYIELDNEEVNDAETETE